MKSIHLANPSLFLALAVASSSVVYADTAHDLSSKADQLKEGVSTKKDAMKMLGKPMKDTKMPDGCTMCTWTDGTSKVTAMFDPEGTLIDVKRWKGGK